MSTRAKTPIDLSFHPIGKMLTAIASDLALHAAENVHLTR